MQLVSGSSGTEQTDEKENAPEADAAKGAGDGYTEGIPGPVTRLIVLANRGLSNLIQDLILVSATKHILYNICGAFQMEQVVDFHMKKGTTKMVNTNYVVDWWNVKKKDFW